MTFESLEDLETAQQMAAERYPEIAHLSEFITANDAAGVMELAADMSRRLKAAGKRQPGPHTTADDGKQTPPAEEEEKPATSAAIIAGFREGRTRPSDPDAASDYMSAKLREAAS